MKAKLIEWIHRYGPAEIAGTAAALVGSFLVYKLSSNEILSAYAGAISENIGFYGVMIRKEYKKYTKTHPLAIARNLFLEFGPAELMDTFLSRPFFMGFGLHFVGPGIGLVLGKLGADLFFYLPAIISFELRKKMNK